MKQFSTCRPCGKCLHRTNLAGRDWHAIGSTQGAGFFDLLALPGQTYEYTVACFSASGVESALSEGIVLTLNRQRGDALFRDNFQLLRGDFLPVEPASTQ